MMNQNMNIEQKRMRSANWSTEMKELLRECVASKISIIDSRENNTSMIKKKHDAWSAIEEQMKANGYNFDQKKLKEQWNRIKLHARSSISQFKRDVKKTGGGECPHQPSDLDYSVASLIPIDFEEDHACFDSNVSQELSEEVEHVKGNIDLNNTREIEREKPKQDTELPTTSFKSNRKRKYPTKGHGEEMIKCRREQILLETSQMKELFEIKRQTENLKMQQMKAIHEKDLQLKEKEIELINLKIDKENQKYRATAKEQNGKN